MNQPLSESPTKKIEQVISAPIEAIVQENVNNILCLWQHKGGKPLRISAYPQNTKNPKINYFDQLQLAVQDLSPDKQTSTSFKEK